MDCPPVGGVGVYVSGRDIAEGCSLLGERGECALKRLDAHGGVHLEHRDHSRKRRYSKKAKDPSGEGLAMLEGEEWKGGANWGDKGKSSYLAGQNIWAPYCSASHKQLLQGRCWSSQQSAPSMLRTGLFGAATVGFLAESKDRVTCPSFGLRSSPPQSPALLVRNRRRTR